MDNIIKTERIKREMTQEELAKLIGVSKQAVCEWEKGRRIPNRKSLRKLSNVFFLTLDCLDKQLGNQDQLSPKSYHGKTG